MTGSGTLLSCRNARLDSFLKRNTERAVYERIRACEPCVVVTETVNKVYMHVVVSDEWVYLTEYPPRTLTAVVNFGRVRNIGLVNDLPEFLSLKDRERCQHIRIIYVTEKPAGKGCVWSRKGKVEEGLPVALSSRRASHCPMPTNTSEGYPAESQWMEQLQPVLKSTRSTSCPNPQTLGLPHPPSQPSSFYSTSSTSPPFLSDESLMTTDTGQVTRSIGSVLSDLLRRDDANSMEEKEAELHLYTVSQKSRLYLHLQSMWNSFIIRSTLMLDPVYRKMYTTCDPLAKGISMERTAHLFGQLSSELLQDGISVELLYLLLQELRTAAHRNLTLRRLFWKCSELCVFLVQTLENCLFGCQSLHGVYTADQLLLSTLIVQTLAIMFRETEVEAARIHLLSAENGALASRMLLALICDPQCETNSRRSLVGSEVLLAEYLDAACSLLFELLLLGQEVNSDRRQTNRCFSTDSILSVGWTFKVLQPHPDLLSFISYQASQVVLVLSSNQKSFLSPPQSVLLFKRCRLLLACLQQDTQLAEHLRFNFRQDFRYLVKPSYATGKLSPKYPISQPTLQLVACILTLIDKSSVICESQNTGDQL
ncbi:uncharacterized protein C12orf56 homolog isoform X2 [Melanotaenia boesemani]|uniref:uncharacterized protein C12orf56 homolog isoform X2 n=1 Tax=Melanotaenia boesemani TaxID=1250792 RepID=UPI001C056FFB|nr:uncharacterized protein C12orf56 homolog isoform X2 [Melanotaenia boesemani]